MRDNVNVLMWFAVDDDGSEWIFGGEPVRVLDEKGGGYWSGPEWVAPLGTGCIQLWTGKDLTWKDTPYMYAGPNYDPSPDTQPSPM